MRQPLNKTVRAFSLVEMLVVLVLSSMVVSIIYLGYYTITTYQNTLTRKQQMLHEISTLYFRLRKDVDKCDVLTAETENDIVCVSAERAIRYAFFAQAVVRTQGSIVDTLHCHPGKPDLFWKGKPVESFPAKIDELDFILALHDSIHFSVIKQYDAASLVETKRDTLP